MRKAERISDFSASRVRFSGPDGRKLQRQKGVSGVRRTRRIGVRRSDPIQAETCGNKFALSDIIITLQQ
ncbi:MAG: hypothetical protein ACLSCF_05500 [Alistipes finegoldii]